MTRRVLNIRKIYKVFEEAIHRRTNPNEKMLKLISFQSNAK